MSDRSPERAASNRSVASEPPGVGSVSDRSLTATAIWLLTSTCYGTWLPGDPRGSVTSVRDMRAGDRSGPARREHNAYGTPPEPCLRGLEIAARRAMLEPVVRFNAESAQLVLRQFLETCELRKWRLFAGAIMWNRFHLIVAAGDAAPRRVLADLKAYASRALNRHSNAIVAKRWWTSGGSVRLLPNDAALEDGVDYVLRRQPLAVFPSDALDSCT